ncbi:hypothetical protein [Microbacterium sp. NC79]|uniref:hypothetical protein n=1 Tax=Microbacterium sp. NC79 TaxID=2851009 RepID=UPI001C2C6130|nr:hypothetical protein [Microbacterium sp. NC79]MBV0894179.1 hypothetical protein [Microbacterium sp. NC79]
MTLADQRGRRAILIAVSLAALAAVVVVLSEAMLRVNSNAVLAPERAEREELMAWLARGLFVLGAGWLTIGIFAARTSLVRRPGAAAARATWLSFSRPWRARESMLGLLALDRWLLVIIPAGLLIATHLVVGSFLSVIPVLIASAGWFVFGAIIIVLVWPRSSWPVISAVSGTAVVWSLVMLAGVAIAGPGNFWLLLWDTSWLRFIVLTLVLAVLAWALIAAGGAITPQIGPLAAVGAVTASIGGTIALVSLVMAVLGPVWLGAQWQDEAVEVMAEPVAVWINFAAGIVLLVGGLVVTFYARRVRAASQRR